MFRLEELENKAYEDEFDRCFDLELAEAGEDSEAYDSEAYDEDSDSDDSYEEDEGDELVEGEVGDSSSDLEYYLF